MRALIHQSLLIMLALLPACLSAAEPWGENGAGNESPVNYPADPLQMERLREQLLDLDPDRENRLLIEQVREAEVANRVEYIDADTEEWKELDGQQLRWGGRLQADWVNWANDQDLGDQSNYFEFRRVRLFAAGSGYGVFDYMLELEFGDDSLPDADQFDDRFRLGAGGVELKDAYLQASDVPYLDNVRIGHFMAPVGLEQLTSSKNITFLERSLPMEFVPGREVGLAAFNHTAIANMTFAGGIFFHDMSDATYAIENDSQGYRLVGRLTHTPIYDQVSGGRLVLHTGLGYAYTQPRRRDDPDLPGVPFYPVKFDARPEIHRGDDLIDTGDLNTQRYHVLDAELALVYGAFSLQGEAVWTRVREFEQGTIDLYGGYLFASYFLTGESRNYNRREASFGPVTPYENFWIVDTMRGPQAGWGAWELAARWSYLDFSDLRGQQLNDLTIGCNWYWNPNTRMMFNWIHPFAQNSPIATAPQAEADILAVRLEVSF